MNESSYQVYVGGDDAFLPFFLIVGILLAVAANLTLLVALLKIQDLEFYSFIKLMCYLDLVAAVTVFPMALTVSANHGVLNNPVFCNIYGILTAFLNRASMLNVCAINVERYYFISRPMHYNHAMPSSLSTAINCGLMGLSLLVALGPIVVSLWTNVDAYKPLSYAPLCASIPTTAILVLLGYVDVIVSFFIPWCIILAVSVGMLNIACKIIHPSVQPIKCRPIARSNGPCKSTHLPGEMSLINHHIFRLSGRINNTRNPARNVPHFVPPTRPNGNLKALVTITTSLCVFTVLNAPMAAFIIIMCSSFENNSSRSSEGPTLEYIVCITMFTTYFIYPLLNGLTNREIRIKMLQMVRNSMSLHIIDIEEMNEISSIGSKVNIQRTPVKIIKHKNTNINIQIVEASVQNSSSINDVSHHFQAKMTSSKIQESFTETVIVHETTNNIHSEYSPERRSTAPGGKRGQSREYKMAFASNLPPHLKTFVVTQSCPLPRRGPKRSNSASDQLGHMKCIAIRRRSKSYTNPPFGGNSSYYNENNNNNRKVFPIPKQEETINLPGMVI